MCAVLQEIFANFSFFTENLKVDDETPKKYQGLEIYIILTEKTLLGVYKIEFICYNNVDMQKQPFGVARFGKKNAKQEGKRND